MKAKNIYELSDEMRIPITKLKRMHALGYLKIERGQQTEIEKAIGLTRRSKPLAVRQLLEFTRDPSQLDSIGAAKLAVRKQIKMLGDIAADAMPIGSHLIIIHAALKSPKEAGALAAYIASIIPAEGCDYLYVAVRLLHNLAPEWLETAHEHAARAVMQARKMPALEGMSATLEGRTKFFRKSFDL